MNKYTRYIYTTLLILSAVCMPAHAQNSYDGEIRFKDVKALRQGDNLSLEFLLDLSEVVLPSQQMIALTPVLVAPEAETEHRFSSIIIAGRTRDKVNQRLKETVLPPDDQVLQYIVRTNKRQQSYPVSLTLPYEEWMRDATLKIDESVSGCAQCDLGQRTSTIADRILPPVHVPEYALQYVMPEAEPIKERDETYAAHLNFRVGKYELLRDFENNAYVLNEVDRIVREIRNDANLTIQTLSIVGYASPEGNYNSNMELSKNRSYSFVNYLIRTHNLNQNIMQTDWKGEDWEGLRKSVESSAIYDRDAVIRIIDQNYDIARRKTQLRALNGGTTYAMLLKEYYPPLRRIEYTFKYVARSFSIEEAKEVLKTKPHHLSLNEMFLVANSYEKGSEDFNHIFDVAVRLFPDDPVANINAAIQEIEMGAVDKAIERLKNIDLPEAQNNLGVAYVKKENFEAAKACFKKAADAGNNTATANLSELEKFLANE